MAELSGLQVFKYLPAAKKLPEGNCKKCGFPTCMAFALKLAKGESNIELCPYAPEELKENLSQSLKKPQKELELGHTNKITVGGENVLYRHDKTFVNPTKIAIVIDINKDGWQEKLDRVLDFEITRIKDVFKVDLVMLKGGFPLTPTLSPHGRGGDAQSSLQQSPSRGSEENALLIVIKKLDDAKMPYVFEDDLKELKKIEETTVPETIKTLTEIRKKAVLEKDENFSDPVYVYFKSQYPSPHPSPARPQSGEGEGEYLLDLMARASFYLCKYANMLIFEDFDEAMVSTLMTLRQNIFTDPQKPLQVESKVYEFNNPDENSLVFLTTNFALTYFAVANEIESLNRPAYLVVTPSDGMSVLTAWSAEKFTAQIVAKTINGANLSEKIKKKEIIIPGLLAHMAAEIKEVLPDFEILTGPNEAYMLGDFVKSLG